MDHREQLAAVFDDVETKLRGAIGAYNTLSAKYETSHRDNAEIGRDIWPLGDWLAKLERATYSFKRFRSMQLSEERPSLPQRDEYAKSPVDKVEYIRCVVEAFEAEAKLSGKRRREYADQANAYLDDLIGAIAATSGAKP